MNDFLKNLRTNNKEKTFDRNDRNDRPNRRQYGNGNYGNSAYGGNPNYVNPQYKNDRNNGNLKKPYRSFDDGRLSALLEEALPEIKTVLARLTGASERLAAAEERKADALERLTASLKILASGNGTAFGRDGDAAGRSGEADAEAPAAGASRPVNLMAREAVLDIILKMRDEGATYGRIANYLEAENIPTFSRKRAWHAQTIHRICRECAV